MALNSLNSLVQQFTTASFYNYSIVCTLEDCMLMMTMNCICGMLNQRIAFSLISSRDHCQRSSPLRISNMPQSGFEPAQNLSSGFNE